MYRGGSRPCFHYLDFQSKIVSYAIYIVKKRPLYVNFSIPPCGNWWFSHSSTHCVGMRFCGHVPNPRKSKNKKRHMLYLLKKVDFLDPKRLLSPFCSGRKNYFFNLNVMISEMVMSESVRFGRHIDIEVSYKILQILVQKLVPILHYQACCRKGLLGGSIEQKHPQSFRG
jgi:hypothetical protein